MPLKPSLFQRSLLTNIGALLSGMVVARLLGALGPIFLARIVGPQSYGSFASNLAILKLFAVAFSLGLDHWLLRYGSREGSKQELATHSASCLAIKAGLGLCWLLLIAGLTPWFNQAVFPFAIIMPIALTVWFEELASVAWTAFNSAAANKTAGFLLAGYQLLQLLVVITLAALGVRSLFPYIMLQGVAGALGCFLSLYWLQRTITLHLDWRDVRRALASSTPFAFSLALALIYGRADVAIVAYWLGNAATGIYSPAVSVITTTFLIPLAIYNVMLPLLSRTHAEDGRAMYKLAVQLTLGSLLIGLVVGGTIALTAYPLAHLLFGEKFQGVDHVLVILSGVATLRCVSFALAAVLTAIGWQTRRTLIQAVVAAASVGTDILIVVRWGVPGVAVVFVLTEALLLIGYLGLVLSGYSMDKKKVQTLTL